MIPIGLLLLILAAEPLTAGELHQAVRDGDAAAARTLLTKGAKVDERDQLGGTALHDACWTGDVDMVNLLLDFKANPNAPHTEGKSTPLHYAIITNHPEVVKILLDRGADPKLAMPAGGSILHLAAGRGFQPIVELLLARGLPVNGRDANGRTPLDEAAWKGSEGTVRLLLAKGAKPGQSLFGAVSRGHAAAAAALLDGGADPNQKDADGWTPLEVALRQRQLPVADLLLGRGVRLTSPRVIRDAVLRGQADVVRLILQRDKSVQPSAFLHDAALKGNVAVAELLLERGANPNFRNEAGGTPLHDAALAGKTEMAALLIARGGEINARETSTGSTALHHAASWGRFETVQFLIDKGAATDVRNRSGLTPAELAKAGGHDDLAALLRSMPVGGPKE